MPKERPSGIFSRIRGLWPRDWRAGQVFRSTLKTISAYTDEHIRPKERLDEVPDVAWRAVEGAASEKHARALSAYADVENKNIETEYLRRTLESRVRLQEAETTLKQQDARIRESEARVREIDEINARLELFAKLKQVGYLPVWDGKGRVKIVAIPSDANLEKFGPALLTPEERAIVGLGEVTESPKPASGSAGKRISPDRESALDSAKARGAGTHTGRGDSPSVT